MRFAGRLAVVAAATFGAAVLSQWAAGTGVKDAYARLDKPQWAPPPQVFGPVWGALYATLSLATALAMREKSARSAWPLFGAHLVANAAWTPLFFRLKNYRLAELDAAMLTLLVLLLAREYGKHNPSAAVLLVPLAGWCGFATALTHAIRRRAAQG